MHPVDALSPPSSFFACSTMMCVCGGFLYGLALLLSLSMCVPFGRIYIARGGNRNKASHDGSEVRIDPVCAE